MLLLFIGIISIIVALILLWDEKRYTERTTGKIIGVKRYYSRMKDNRGYRYHYTISYMVHGKNYIITKKHYTVNLGMRFKNRIKI